MMIMIMTMMMVMIVMMAVACDEHDVDYEIDQLIT